MNYKLKSGFTLIEILVVIGVLAIIVIVGSTSFFNLLKGSTKTRTANLVKQNGDYAMGVMTRMIRGAREIVSDCPGSSSSIQILNPDGKNTMFDCSDSAISSTSATTGNQVPITSDQVEVDSCSFDCERASILEPDVVTIDFTLSTGDPTQPEEYATVNFKTTVVLRNIVGYD